MGLELKKKSDANGSAKEPKEPKASGKGLNLKKELSSANKLPSKTTMNLYQPVKDENDLKTFIPGLIIVIIVVLLLAKFGVVGRIQHLNELESQVATQQQLLDSMVSQLTDYDDIKTKYIRYTKNYMSDEEGGVVDRIRIIDLISNKVENIGKVDSININGNTVSLAVIVSKLDQVRQIRKQLEGVDWVSNVVVYTASTSNSNGKYVTASMVFNVSRIEGDEDATTNIALTGLGEDAEGADAESEGEVTE